jgi:hypothetical protein
VKTPIPGRRACATRPPGRFSFVAGAVLLTALQSATLSAQTEATVGTEFRLGAHVFFSNVSAAAVVNGAPAIVGDSTLKIGLDVRAAVRRGRWALTGEFRRSDSNSRGDLPTGVDGIAFELQIREFEFSGAYRIGPATGPQTIDALLGTRHVRHRRIRSRGLPNERAVTASWLEPFAGFRFATGLGGRFRFATSGNIGGWGLGSSFTWVIEGELGARLFERVEFVTRYRYSQAEFDSPGRYEWDNGQVQGWLFGLEAVL